MDKKSKGMGKKSKDMGKASKDMGKTKMSINVEIRPLIRASLQ